MQHTPNMSLIQVMLVDDDVNFQNVLIDAIQAEPDMALQQVAGSLRVGLQILDKTQPDVLLVELSLPDGSGIDLIRAAYSKWPQCSIMVNTIFCDELNVMMSFEAGAYGYLLKDSSHNKLVAEIRSLHAGGSPISPLIARQILTRFRPQGKIALLEPTHEKKLSLRETEVLKLITKGFSSDEIAELLCISRHTVLTFVRRIYSKLKVNSKTEAIYEARKLGLINDVL